MFKVNLKEFFKTFFTLSGDALKELLKNDPLRMAGATAFFTTFALPPILVILIQSLGLFLGYETIYGELYTSLAEIFGMQTASQLKNVLNNIRDMAQNWYITIMGFLFLVFVATTLFKVIKSSINQLWSIRVHGKRGVIKGLRARGQSLVVIMVAGLLFAIGLLSEGVRAFIGSYIFEISPLLSVYFNTFLNQVVSLVIVMLWFTIVFRYLPDGKPQWKIAFPGALVTALLFSIGKFILHWLLTYSNIKTVYGTSTSIVLILLFVFYSSLIMYYGAAFTKVLANHKGYPILPRPYAIYYKLMETNVEERLNTD